MFMARAEVGKTPELKLSDSPREVLSLDVLKARNKRIAQLLVAGLSDKDTAQAVGVSPGTVSALKKQPLFLSYMDKLQAMQEADVVNIRAELEELAPKAVKRLEMLLNSQQQGIALAASKDILDRAGYNKVEKVQQFNANVHITPEQMSDIRQKIEEMRKLGVVV